MHDDLATFERAVRRIAQDTLVHLVRQEGREPAFVRVAVPEAWAVDDFAAALTAEYAARGFGPVQVQALPTQGEPRLLSVVSR